MSREILSLPKKIQVSDCGRPPGMSFKELIKWWFSPYYKEETDDMVFLHKKHGDHYYLMRTIYLKKNTSVANIAEDEDEFSEDL